MSQHEYIDLSKARVLLSNDDGIDAHGIKVLEKTLRGLAKEVWVVAPATEQSAAGHALTLRRPLRIQKRSKNHYSVDGTPTDCVLLAINEIMKDNPPDMVISGINNGGNLGDDVTYSGTVAAAMEATILGIPAIALSQHYEDGQTIHWPTAAKWLPKVLKKITGVSTPKDTLLNINFPNVPAKDVRGIEVTKQGQLKVSDAIQVGKDPRGVPYYWVGAQNFVDQFKPGTDLRAVYDGYISITPLSTNLTNTPVMKTLKKVFS